MVTSVGGCNIRMGRYVFCKNWEIPLINCT